MNIEKYLEFAESLKLVRNEYLEDNNSKNLINEIYTDPLPNNGVISKINLPRTTIVVGRKGTGKSTIFQKSIKDISKKKDILCLYIDVKTLYDNSTPIIIDNKSIISSEEMTKYLMYLSFIKQLILEVKDQINDKLNRSFLKGIFKQNKDDLKTVKYRLDDIYKNAEKVFKTISLTLTNIANTLEQSQTDNEGIGLELSLEPKVNLESSNEKVVKFKKSFDDTLITYFDIKKCLIDNLLSIREIANLKYLYVYLDDYSEIDEAAQMLFMDSLVAPLNNLADNFVKFKIATYPRRFYYGKLDNQKVDEISLDFFEAYNTFKNISKMEELALDYTGRLINNRAKIFFENDEFSRFFEMKEFELIELLFELSMNIPRKMGYVLSYCYESSLIHEKKITKAALANASVRYYDEVIKRYFESNKYILRPFHDKVSIENQKDLIDKVIKKQVNNKSSISRSNAKLFNVEGRPTSHFVIMNELSNLMDNLELNGYVTTYNKINDKNNIPSTLYALDYGLCRKNNLNYGRPKDTKFRKYYNDSRFNFNNVIRSHFNETQILKCDEGHEFPFECYEQFKKFSFSCPTCIENNKISKVKIVVSNQELIERIREIERESIVLNDDNEYNLLDCLRVENPKSLSCKEIASFIDCSWQFVNKRADKLIELALIEVDEKKSKSQNRRYFKITSKALEIVFKQN